MGRGAPAPRVRELVILGFDLELTAFEQVEIDLVLDIDPVAPGDVEEEEGSSLEPGSVPPVVIAGDIFRAGRHEIGCGDARNHQLLASLIVGRSAPVVFTDPPYNVKIAGFVSGLGRKRHREFAMASGEMTKREFVDFLADSLAALIPHLTDGAILYLCIDWRHMAELLDAAWRNELTLKNLCVWCKTNAGNGTFYRSQHELVFVFKHGNGQHRITSNSASTVAFAAMCGPMPGSTLSAKTEWSFSGSTRRLSRGR